MAAEMEKQSAETLALLAPGTHLSALARGPTEDLERWQAAVARSVEARLYAEFDTFLAELEPSLRDSGRQVTRGLLGGGAATPTLTHPLVAST